MGGYTKNSDRPLTVNFLYHFPNWNKSEMSEIIANSAKHQSPRRPSVAFEREAPGKGRSRGKDVDLDKRSWYIRTARCRFTNLGGTMRRITLVSSAVAFCLTVALAIGVTAARKPASPVADLPSGKVELQSAGALAFGPTGILFVGDSVGGSIVAIDTGDTKAMKT